MFRITPLGSAPTSGAVLEDGSTSRPRPLVHDQAVRGKFLLS